MPPFRLRAAAPGKNYQLGLGSSAAAFSESKKDTGEITRRVLDGGQNPPAGVMIFYWIKEKIEGELTLQILDSNDNLIKRFSNIKADESDESKELILGFESGVNRFVWDMRYPEAVVVPEDKATQDALTGPLAPPGLYKVVLTHDEYSQTQDFEILKDPRVTATQEDLMTQFELLIKLRDSLSHANKTVNDIRNLKTQVTEWVKRAEGTSVSETVFSNGSSVITKLESVEREIVQIDYKGSRDMLNLPPKLNLKFVELINFVAAADYAPPKQAYEATEDFNGSLEPLMQSYDTILEKDLSEFENLIAELEIPSVSV